MTRMTFREAATKQVIQGSDLQGLIHRFRYSFALTLETFCASYVHRRLKTDSYEFRIELHLPLFVDTISRSLCFRLHICRFSEASSSCCSSSDEEQSKPLRRAQASRVRRSLRRHPKSGAQYAQAAMGNLAPNLQKALRQDCMREDDVRECAALLCYLISA